MQSLRNSAIITALLAVSAAVASAQISKWQIDPAHSEADFTIRHMGISNVHGRFGNLSGSLNLDEKDITKSDVNATVDIATVDTGTAQRDQHLKSPDFFDAARYPQMTFVSKGLTNNNGQLQLIGDLTIHGVTKPVTLALDGPSKEQADPYGKIRRGFSATTTIHRQDYGLTWNGNLKSGDTVLGDDVKVELDIELIKQ
ncbi:YceI family protein [Alloacidobacterium dinghuense]|uniref:YceI family protein n=1 Tax=Alloacidobacterium dinghuense TaxID=2763107 RepID=A0A7G8BCT0_9BACT|nr:YceI family protein [Alloacidobacterium dinghuense]QNI30350.1 YceI family protein [Alloacidobacterium dinghuense]